MSEDIVVWNWLKRWAASAVEAGVAEALAKRAGELPKPAQDAVGAVPAANAGEPLPELSGGDESPAKSGRRGRG